MSANPFLMNFKQEVPCLDPEETLDGDAYCEKLQMRVLPDGSLLWNARTRRCPTSCFTSGHRIKAGYTRSGKYRPSKFVKGKTDKRAGK